MVFKRIVISSQQTRRCCTVLAVCAMLLPLLSCDALNPAFIAAMGGAELAAGSISVDAGLIPVVFQNNTTFDPEILAFLEDVNDETITLENLRPRVILTVQVTLADGGEQTVRFVAGSPVWQRFRDNCTKPPEGEDIPPEFQDIIEAPVDLIDNESNNKVFPCDVGVIQVTDVQVYIPTTLKTFRTVGDFGLRELSTVEPPHFGILEEDIINEDGTLTRRNFDRFDRPPAVDAPLCGAVVAITMTGELSLPFLADQCAERSPGLLDTDDIAENEIPGRFRIEVNLLGNRPQQGGIFGGGT